MSHPDSQQLHLWVVAVEDLLAGMRTMRKLGSGRVATTAWRVGLVVSWCMLAGTSIAGDAARPAWDVARYPFMPSITRAAEPAVCEAVLEQYKTLFLGPAAEMSFTAAGKETANGGGRIRWVEWQPATQCEGNEPPDAENQCGKPERPKYIAYEHALVDLESTGVKQAIVRWHDHYSSNSIHEVAILPLDSSDHEIAVYSAVDQWMPVIEYDGRYYY